MAHTERALVLEQDPASSRLAQQDVIDIHQLHRDGTPWDDIAAIKGINRKQVQRIVQGRRHRDLHPAVRPDLYGDNEDDNSILRPTSTEPEDQTAYAVMAVTEAAVLIKSLHDRAGEWPGWSDDAALLVSACSNLLELASEEVVRKMKLGN